MSFAIQNQIEAVCPVINNQNYDIQPLIGQKSPEFSKSIFHVKNQYFNLIFSVKISCLTNLIILTEKIPILK